MTFRRSNHIITSIILISKRFIDKLVQQCFFQVLIQLLSHLPFPTRIPNNGHELVLFRARGEKSRVVKLVEERRKRHSISRSLFGALRLSIADFHHNLANLAALGHQRQVLVLFCNRHVLKAVSINWKRRKKKLLIKKLIYLFIY